jgi:aminoglycoside/choline kinase family phosphotransferase
MLPETILSSTRTIFPDFEEQECRVLPLEQGGSGRLYYRIEIHDRTIIFAKYNDHREENRHFVDIARFLERCGVQVPKIFHHDAAEGLIWMQDLGTQDLWSFREAAWPVRRSLYSSALRQVARLHAQGMRLLQENPLSLQLEFDENLYLWEQEYFFEHGVRGVFGFPEDEVASLAASPALLELARRLAQRPRCLVHRDFQSQNVLIHEASAWLIDFQGMRPGLPHYDVASLLFDPYVTLADGEREELIQDYLQTAAAEGLDLAPEFEEVFLGCAAQRLMQALGAYGFLGLKCGRPAFLRHVPSAKKSLRQVLTRLEGLESVIQLLDHAREPETI